MVGTTSAGGVDDSLRKVLLGNPPDERLKGCSIAALKGRLSCDLNGTHGLDSIVKKLSIVFIEYDLSRENVLLVIQKRMRAVDAHVILLEGLPWTSSRVLRYGRAKLKLLLLYASKFVGVLVSSCSLGHVLGELLVLFMISTQTDAFSAITAFPT